MTRQSEHVNKWRENHHRALETLRSPDCKKTGIQLWRGLRRIESYTHHAATAYCNGDMYEDTYETVKAKAEKGVKKIFGKLPDGFFINSDPRGYALKLDEKHVPKGMHTDWGGYGILAATIE